MGKKHITSGESTSNEDDVIRARDAYKRAGGNDMEQRVTFDLVLSELRAHHFTVLSTVDEDGTPDSAGVNYGVSALGRELALYVMTRRHLKKTRDIARNPRVSLVIPLPRRLLWFVPPATIQLHGRAEILDWPMRRGRMSSGASGWAGASSQPTRSPDATERHGSVS